MKTVHKCKERFWCDYCKKLVRQGGVFFVNSPQVGAESLELHFCNKSQYEKWVAKRFQMPLLNPCSNTGVTFGAKGE